MHGKSNISRYASITLTHLLLDYNIHGKARIRCTFGKSVNGKQIDHSRPRPGRNFSGQLPPMYVFSPHPPTELRQHCRQYPLSHHTPMMHQFASGCPPYPVISPYPGGAPFFDGNNYTYPRSRSGSDEGRAMSPPGRRPNDMPAFPGQPPMPYGLPIGYPLFPPFMPAFEGPYPPQGPHNGFPPMPHVPAFTGPRGPGTTFSDQSASTFDNASHLSYTTDATSQYSLYNPQMHQPKADYTPYIPTNITPAFLGGTSAATPQTLPSAPITTPTA